MLIRLSEPTTIPPSLGEAVPWIKKLGGFLAQMTDSEPVHPVLRRGFQHLPYITNDVPDPATERATYG